MSVVMPFAGDPEAARTAIGGLLALTTRPGDELILADNTGTALQAPGVRVVRAIGERSPAHARNAGAAHARGDWILFLDADCVPPAELLEHYFATEIEDRVGVLAGEVMPAPGATTLAERYASQRSFLSQQAHVAHPYRARAAAANLMVRRTAFAALGGFHEGLRAAEDTDFCWRLPGAGWRLEIRPGARVEHRYRASVGDLRRQWRGYAAGRAWLARRYEGFAPEPAVVRAASRLARMRAGSRAAPPRAAPPPAAPPPGRLERICHRGLDVLLGFDELAGFVLSNRPAGAQRDGGARSVLVTERLPAPGDPLVELALAVGETRVEAAARPEVAQLAVRGLRVDYREDDGAAARVGALIALAARHPFRCTLDVWGERAEGPSLPALAPAAMRLERDGGARVQSLGGVRAQSAARRLTRLTGRPVHAPDSS